MSWRRYADWAKHRPTALRLADRLGRGRGRFRVLDRVRPPPMAPHVPDLRDWERKELAAVWIGHATVLLRVGDLTVLTDPVLGNRVGVGLGLVTGGPRRLVAPALRVHDLPKIDVVLLSHAHFDHLDRPTLSRLDHHAKIVTARRTRDLVDDLGFFSVTELAWDEHVSIGDVTIRARAVKHWGARTFFDLHRGYNAYTIESRNRSILYAGDSAYHDSFAELGDCGGVDLAIVGIGAYDPWVGAHATPEQAWAMALHAGARHVLPMHHSTFKLSHEPLAEPMHRLMAAANNHTGDNGQHCTVVIKAVGQQWAIEK